MRSIHGPSDHQCLRAAERALAAHLATRPATTAEALAIAASHRAEHAALIAGAKRLEHAYAHPPIVDGRGAWVATEKHAAGIVATQHLQEAGRTRQAAIRPLMLAEAWEAIAPDPSVAWEQTRGELETRAAYYRGLIDARAAARAGA